jgi:hypothetical protein
MENILHVKEESGASDKDAVGYEPPALRDLGTLGELTRGVTQSGTDGVLPGSAIPS